MADPNTQPAGEAQQTPPAATEQTPPATDNGTGPNAGNEGEEKKFSQAELNAAIDARLKREREQADTKAKKATEEAEAQRLKEQAAWEQLATTNEAKVKELQPQVETLTAERDRLVEIVTATLDNEIKDWADEVKALIPADVDVLTKYATVERTRPLAAKLAGTPPPQGNGMSPKPNGGAAGTDQAARDRMAAFTRSRF